MHGWTLLLTSADSMLVEGLSPRVCERPRATAAPFLASSWGGSYVA